MAQTPPDDSNLELTFVPLSETGDASLWSNFDSSIDLSDVNRLPVIDLDSDDPLPTVPEVDQRPASRSGAAAVTTGAESATQVQAPGEFWMEGDVVMCGCPDCAAPMSIRLWLMIADCWHCGTSIELTEEQEREVQRLLAERERQRRQARAARRPATAVTPAGTTPTQPTEKPAAKPEPATETKAAPAAPARVREKPTPQTVPQRDPAPQRRRVSAAQGLSIGARARIRKMAASGSISVWFSDLFRMTPAWLISAVIHFVLLMLLALLNVPRDEKAEAIVLATSVSKVEDEGEVKVEDPSEELHFDLPLPEDVDMSDAEVKEAMIRANQDARELRLDPNDPNPQMAELGRVKSRIRNEYAPRTALAARDPRVRIDMVKHEGGTTETEAAVARGLRWLSRHQNPDGSWSLKDFHKPQSDCKCSGGSVTNDIAGTSLALLPFLGAGQTHLTGIYTDTVAGGLGWMVKNQREDGYLLPSGKSTENSHMYAHGQAAIVLCEAFAMEGDERLRIPAQKAIDFIARAQHAGGGWRYQPGQAGDMSVVGWQLMALQSGRAAGLSVDESTLKLAGKFLDSVAPQSGNYRKGSRYEYMRGRGPTEVMTAEALLCRMYLGWNQKEHPQMMDGIKWLASKENLPSPDKENMYYWYYATQAMHHVGGEDWIRWNQQMRNILVDLQETKGCAAGSWPHGDFAWAQGGRVYVTALATCTLEVYYRHLPIFKQIELE